MEDRKRRQEKKTGKEDRKRRQEKKTGKEDRHVEYRIAREES
jgi:hypothetical protein